MVILLGYTGRAEAAGKVQLKNTTISVYKTVYTYNGRVQKPAVSVRYRGKKLSVNKDYTLVYSKGRKNPGVYTVAVKGKGSYSGTVKRPSVSIPLAQSWLPCRARLAARR